MRKIRKKKADRDYVAKLSSSRIPPVISLDSQQLWITLMETEHWASGAARGIPLPPELLKIPIEEIALAELTLGTPKGAYATSPSHNLTTFDNPSEAERSYPLRYATQSCTVIPES
ncbi:hypothetical protein AJ80_08855 [Polytolypa hystricis UAMH7299]|uniref:Uncharacterized protein n=1 Tax=Polytolypa hystricis (strain UAMH7299) TaxID=1447883 RepID=A0A2B7X0G0_POLH7|nr:hypothetical protein AJ80_08855 [Polytolypa hystricis UAMH7299]